MVVQKQEVCKLFVHYFSIFFLVLCMVVLIWVDTVDGYSMWVMMASLTNVWKLGFTYATAIVNVFIGIAIIMPIGMIFLVDAFVENYWMLLLCRLSYSLFSTLHLFLTILYKWYQMIYAIYFNYNKLYQNRGE